MSKKILFPLIYIIVNLLVLLISKSSKLFLISGTFSLFLTATIMKFFPKYISYEGKKLSNDDYFSLILAGVSFLLIALL
ncbi:hypothetical protein SAMN02745135_02412 [Caloranaerobacter azorensis DSM 13643]|uniref:Uncharacterized protein n=1 Tax=Caloranaerobacter azorensis DSM 13643 TaxID=1121264 RepID=A0A1M5WCD5_9FIRM|nr:hypothetical protein [Caloranaerobacter azorensis]SHH85249.1 hypothetical protein SAMN02745135_02412 [Caloranaerobacter azorensis DSM 13643]